MDIVIDDISMDELKRTRANFYLVFEYVDHDLIGLLESKELVDFNKDQICSLFKQLLEVRFFFQRNNFQKKKTFLLSGTRLHSQYGIFTSGY